MKTHTPHTFNPITIMLGTCSFIAFATMFPNYWYLFLPATYCIWKVLSTSPKEQKEKPPVISEVLLGIGLIGSVALPIALKSNFLPNTWFGLASIGSFALIPLGMFLQKGIQGRWIGALLLTFLLPMATNASLWMRTPESQITQKLEAKGISPEYAAKVYQALRPNNGLGMMAILIPPSGIEHFGSTPKGLIQKSEAKYLESINDSILTGSKL